MQIQCPHCQVAIELVDVVPGSDVTCPKCGSLVSSSPRDILTEAQPADDPNVLAKTRLYHDPDATGEPKSASAAKQLTTSQRPPMIEAFGRFQLLKRLGGGAYGEVFWAYDPQLDRDVAIKRPHQRRLPPELAERFAREARSAAQLQHRHIVGTYEVGEVDGRPYIASEYILGTDLAALANAQKDQNRLLPPRDIAQLCAQVAEALHVAHEASIVHRDLKPANILIRRLGLRPDSPSPPDSNRHSNTGRDGVPTYETLHPYITDFGMAKRDTEAEYVMTQAGQLLGSPAYMSPEQWQDSHAVDRRTDLWAVGVILFELLTGERPFRAERDKRLLMQQILNADPPPPSQLNSQVPADLDTLCLKCLEKDPSRRFFIVRDFIDGVGLDESVQAHSLTVRKSVELNAKIADALHHAHEAGVMHRDLKLRNILADNSGEPHVADFGLTQLDVSEITITFEGAILGTAAYNAA